MAIILLKTSKNAKYLLQKFEGLMLFFAVHDRELIIFSFLAVGRTMKAFQDVLWTSYTQQKDIK